jgi:iron complex transport system substrate-binding protein
MKEIILYALLVIVLTCGCKQSDNNTYKSERKYLEKQHTKHAKGFSISSNLSTYIVEVNNPWQGAQNIQYRYAFTHKDTACLLTGFDEVIPFPVRRVVCLSTTHIAYIDLLDAAKCIVGVSGAQYVSNSVVREQIMLGYSLDVGYEQSLNYELLVDLKPDLVFSYGVGAESAGYLQKLKDLKIPVIFIAEYLEENPLGKSEWLKVFGVVFEKYEKSDTLFSQIEREYIDIKNNVAGIKTKPNVFINLPWKDTWFFPGNRSYMVCLIEDAGGNYMLNNLMGNQSYPFSMEVALEKGMNADIWINSGMANSLNDIAIEFPRLTILPPFRNSSIFNNNKRENSSGGNDFWESGVVEPNIILKDLVKIFYPDSIDHELVYYKKLK